MLLHNATLFDPVSAQRQQGALLVEDGCITRILAKEDPLLQELKDRCKAVDCRAGFLMPGFFDAHTHFVLGGEFLRQLDCDTLKHKDSLLQAIHGRALEVSNGPEQRSGWLLGYGISPSHQQPSLAELDEASGGIPLRLETHDLHSSLCNSRALELAGIHAGTKDPEGGEIQRDQEGQPTGYLRENAAYLMRPIVPPANNKERGQFALQAQDHANSLGITGVGENLRRTDLPILQKLEQEGRLHLRIHGWRNDGNLVSDTPELKPWFSPFIRLDTVKLFLDGALGSRSAAMFDPYSDGSRGDLVAPPDEVRAWMRRAVERGWRLATHAIGDRAVSQCLDIHEELEVEYGNQGDWKHRIEHLQFVRAEDLLRFRRLEVLASIQPLHSMHDQDHFDGLVTAEQRAIGYPWRSLLKKGIRMAIGSDWPVETLDPRVNLYAGSCRTSWQGQQLLAMDECFRMDELLKGMTWDSARAAGFKNLGCLTEGAAADLVLLEQDPADCEGRDLMNLSVIKTWSAGRQVYSSEI